MTIEPRLLTDAELAEVRERHEFFKAGDVDAVWCIRLLAHIAAQDARRDQLLELIARMSRETPYQDEVKGWEDQRRAMIAEIGTLRARVSELETTNPAGDAARVGDEAFELVKNATERMDQMGLSGAIEVDWIIEPSGHLTMRGTSKLRRDSGR